MLLCQKVEMTKQKHFCKLCGEYTYSGNRDFIKFVSPSDPGAQCAPCQGVRVHIWSGEDGVKAGAEPELLSYTHSS